MHSDNPPLSEILLTRKAGPRLSVDSTRWMADAAFALALLIFLAPLMLAVAALIAASEGGSPIFVQKRIGRGGRPFNCLKFRTMQRDAESRLAHVLQRDPEARAYWETHRKLPVDPRVTPVGRFLRLTSLDELPQLINVLRGEMALVGPRPIVEAEIPRFGRYFRYYCSVRPGLTGLWQVSGRNRLTFRKRVAMDVAYVKARRLTLDLKILVLTVNAVVLQKGSA